jgi:two-component system sensor histidine kinase KdpD
LACVLAATIALVPARGVLSAPQLVLVFVPVIVVVARLSGVRASVAAVAAALLLLDFMFVPPYYHLSVASSVDWVTLLVFLVIAVTVGQQASQLRTRERAASRRQGELEMLNRLSSRIASETSFDATVEFFVRQVADVLGADRVALYVAGADNAGSRCVAEAGSVRSAASEGELVSWVMGTAKAVGMIPSEGVPYDQRAVSVGPADAVPGIVADGVYLPLQTSSTLHGVLVVRLTGKGRPTADDARLLAAVANLAASYLERQHLGEEAAHAEALREADRLKTTLVSSVSHELKTPLAAATARVTGLLEEAGECDPSRLVDELTIVAQDLDRLNASIVDLLDLSRLESDAWQPHLERNDISDILGTVRARLSMSQRERVEFHLDADLPAVCVDFSQLARALTNLVENALAYSPASEPVAVGATSRGGSVEIWVEDRGPGVAGEEKTHVFEKFFRGKASGSVPSGTGLGLTIAGEITRSHHGTLRVEDADPRGARFVLTLPADPWEDRL